MEQANTTPHRRDAIARELGVTPDFDAAAELERRIAFLADYLTRSGRAGYVLGVSGGVDSTVAARMAQLAVERVRGQAAAAWFVAVRLPYGDQRDEEDAARALDFVAPDRRMRIDIKPAVDAQRAALRDADFREQVSSITAPTLVISSTHDLAATPAQGQELAAAIPGARYVELNTSHISNWEQPEAFTRVVVDFLTG